MFMPVMAFFAERWCWVLGCEDASSGMKMGLKGRSVPRGSGLPWTLMLQGLALLPGREMVGGGTLLRRAHRARDRQP